MTAEQRSVVAQALWHSMQKLVSPRKQAELDHLFGALMHVMTDQRMCREEGRQEMRAKAISDRDTETTRFPATRMTH